MTYTHTHVPSLLLKIKLVFEFKMFFREKRSGRKWLSVGFKGNAGTKKRSKALKTAYETIFLLIKLIGDHFKPF